MATAQTSSSSSDAQASPRKRPKPGERRIQILQTLAAMLEQPGAERITTAALAARLEVSEAALYRHFASKAQMFEGLIEFIETSIFSLLNQIAEKK
jgi:TetR/AcrR family transcriptional regulator